MANYCEEKKELNPSFFIMVVQKGSVANYCEEKKELNPSFFIMVAQKGSV